MIPSMRFTRKPEIKFAPIPMLSYNRLGAIRMGELVPEGGPEPGGRCVCSADALRTELLQTQEGLVKLFTVPVAASMLGVKEKTLRDWIWKRKIEAVRNGTRYVRISEEAIHNFIQIHTVPVDSPGGSKKKKETTVTALELNAHAS